MTTEQRTVEVNRKLHQQIMQASLPISPLTGLAGLIVALPFFWLMILSDSPEAMLGYGVMGMLIMVVWMFVAMFMLFRNRPVVKVIKKHFAPGTRFAIAQQPQGLQVTTASHTFTFPAGLTTSTTKGKNVLFVRTDDKSTRLGLPAELVDTTQLP